MNPTPFDQFYKKLYDSKQELEQRRSRLFISTEKLKVVDEDVTSSIFLACLVGIREFYTAFFDSIGIKIKTNQRVHAFSQVEFQGELGSNEKDIPDGLLLITDGLTNPMVVWAGLLEFKTKGDLDEAQVRRYSDIARNRKYGFDAVITVSNDFVPDPTHNPLGMKNYASMKFYHFSWIRIQAMLQYTIQQGVADDDQVYLAEQYALYLNDHKFIKSFDEMNPEWPNQVSTIKAERTLSKSKHKQLLEDVANDWLQEEQDLGLKLKASYGKNISLKLVKDEMESQSARIDSIKETLLGENTLTSAYQVKPSAAKQSPFKISKKRNLEIVNEVILDTSTQIVSISIDNSNCTPKTLKKRLEFFILPLLDSEPGFASIVDVEVTLGNRGGTFTKNVEQYVSDVNRDILNGFGDVDAKAEIKNYKIVATHNLAAAASNRKKFISKVEENFISFYSQYVEPFIE